MTVLLAIFLNIQHGSSLHMFKGWNDLLHIHPSILDCIQSYDQDWCNQQPSTQICLSMFDKCGETCPHIETHGGETIAIDEGDDPSNSEGTKDEPIDDTDVTLVDLNYSGNRHVHWHVHQAYLYHMVHNTDTTFTDGKPTSHGPKCITPMECNFKCNPPMDCNFNVL